MPSPSPRRARPAELFTSPPPSAICPLPFDSPSPLFFRYLFLSFFPFLAATKGTVSHASLPPSLSLFLSRGGRDGRVDSNCACACVRVIVLEDWPAEFESRVSIALSLSLSSSRVKFSNGINYETFPKRTCSFFFFPFFFKASRLWDLSRFARKIKT